MEYNTCKVCGANNGRAGNLISSPSQEIESACGNCYDSLKTGNMVLHTNLRRTDDEVARMMAAVELKYKKVEGK
jgi:hypothetical protein